MRAKIMPVFFDKKLGCFLQHIVVLMFVVVINLVMGNGQALAGWVGSASFAPSAPMALPMINEFAISDTALTGFEPSVAYNSKHDEYLVVWGDPYNIYGQRINSRGELLGDDFSIAENLSVREFSPDVTYDATHDQYLVVWVHEHSTSDWDIYGRLIPYDGSSSLYNEFPIDSSSSNSLNPKVVYALAQGYFLVVWEDAPAAPGLHTIHGRLVNEAGVISATKHTLASHASQHRANPNVAYNLARNEYLVVYDDTDPSVWVIHNESVYATRFAGDVTQLGSEFIIANGADDEIKPAVAACNSADQYLVAFTAVHASGQALYLRYVAGDGNPGGSIYQVDLSISSSPYSETDLACRWGVQYFVTWEHWDVSAASVGIRGQLWYSDGTSDTTLAITNPATSRDEEPTVAGGANSPNFLVAWQRDDKAGYADVYGTILGDTKPKADFTYTPSSGDTNTTFQFDASSSSDHEDAASLLQVRWDWENDGTYDTSYSTTKTASHKFSPDGTYTVKLEVLDTYGNTNTKTKQVVVNNAPPTAAFTVNPTIGDASTYFTFDASGCKDNEDATSALQVRWDWFNDGTWDTLWDTNKTVGVTFGGATFGQLNVKLEVMDSGGLTGTTTGSVTIDNAPTATFTVSPSSGDTNTTFQFDASNSSDPDVGVYWLEVRWDWEDDGTYDTNWSTTKTATHTYSTPGTYTVRLEVRQFAGSLTDTTTKQIKVTQASGNTAPTASFTVNPPSRDTTTVFQFDASGSSDHEDAMAALQVRWDWEGDGTYDTSWSTIKTASHTYTTVGAYTVRLQVRDSGNLTGTTTKQVQVFSAGVLQKVYLPILNP